MKSIKNGNGAFNARASETSETGKTINLNLFISQVNPPA